MAQPGQFDDADDVEAPTSAVPAAAPAPGSAVPGVTAPTHDTSPARADAPADDYDEDDDFDLDDDVDDVDFSDAWLGASGGTPPSAARPSHVPSPRLPF